MAFQKKTWVDRQTQYPNKRTLTPVSGENNAYTVARAEGDVFAEGDKFDAENMNDLENRIETEFIEISNSLPIIDSSLSNTSENPVQNKVIKAELDKIESIACNNNILINSNFCYAVNQRGITANTWINGAYGLDMWALSGNNYKVDSITSNGLTISGTSTFIYQLIEPYKVDLTKNHTLSAKINGKVYSVTGKLGANYDSGKFRISWANDQIKNMPYFYIITDDGSPITIEWAKLEQSEFATPYHIPPYDEELRKCQYYYRKIPYNKSDFIYGTTNKHSDMLIINQMYNNTASVNLNILESGNVKNISATFSSGILLMNYYTTFTTGQNAISISVLVELNSPI